MRLANFIATAWGLMAVVAAYWLIRPVPPDRRSPETTAAPPGESELSRGAADTSANRGIGSPVAEGPPASAAPESPSFEPPKDPATPHRDTEESGPGSQLGGLPADGDELRAMRWPDVEALAGILQEAGVGPEAMRLHLRAVYGHVQRLRLYRGFRDHAETRLGESREAETTGVDGTARGGDVALRTGLERLAQADRDRVDEYEAYVRRSLARDLAITNQVVLERILELAGSPAEPGPGTAPEPEMGTSP